MQTRQRNSYFPVPGFDCSPDGPIILGSILTDSLEPEEPLTDKPISLDGETVRRDIKTNVRMNLRGAGAASGGLLATILGDFGSRISGSTSKSAQTVARFEKLETSSFEPTDSYMDRSLSAPKVQQYLARHHMRKRLFIITGIKIASRGRVTDGESSLRGADLSLGLDGNSLGVPITMGPQAKVSKESSRTISFDVETPFVFAYRLREIRYRKGRATHKPYRDGALYGIRSSGNGEAGATGHETPIETALFLSIDEEDVTAEDIGLESLLVNEHDDSEAAAGRSELADADEICELILLP